MAESAIAWAEPKWLLYRKHRPIAGMDWTEMVKATTQRQPARYHPRIDVGRQQDLEMRCVRRGIVLSEFPSKRTYYYDAGEIIGASCGEETGWILAEWSIQGEVHGRPITKDELLVKGAKIG